MHVTKLIDDSRYARGIELLEGIVAMLTKMDLTTFTTKGSVDVQVHVDVDVKVNA